VAAVIPVRSRPMPNTANWTAKNAKGWGLSPGKVRRFPQFARHEKSQWNQRTTVDFVAFFIDFGRISAI
jgi:hypothetical protein